MDGAGAISLRCGAASSIRALVEELDGRERSVSRGDSPRSPGRPDGTRDALVAGRGGSMDAPDLAGVGGDGGVVHAGREGSGPLCTPAVGAQH